MGTTAIVNVALPDAMSHMKGSFPGSFTSALTTARTSYSPMSLNVTDTGFPVAVYHTKVEKVLRSRGFKEDMREDAPICRWVRDDITLDAMPIDASILGFTNLWYEAGFAFAYEVEVESGVSIRILRASHLLATKLEAFKGRGGGDRHGRHRAAG